MNDHLHLILIYVIVHNLTFDHEDHSIIVATDALGEVNFSISGSAEAQSKFERGLALMHHMMYVQAEKEFTALADMEPNCAMAYWGVAMTWVRGFRNKS